MTSKKHWEQYASWSKAEQAWDSRAKKTEKEHPLKVLKNLPQMPGITEETKKNLSWKSFKYMIQHDEKHALLKKILKHPVRYAIGYVKSLLKKQSYTRDDDFFLYNIDDIEHFRSLLEEKNTMLVVGFSYCHKPLECPSGRFNSDCIQNAEHPVCQQCFIGKTMHSLPKTAIIPLIIPTVHYIGNQILEISQKYHDKQILFIITACEMTLEMFSDWGNMAHIKGVGVRLDGRICNTMRAFELSEEGIKPGLTVVLPETQKRILELIRHRKAHTS